MFGWEFLGNHHPIFLAAAHAFPSQTIKSDRKLSRWDKI
jgi:hypothetical protein